MIYWANGSHPFSVNKDNGVQQISKMSNNSHSSTPQSVTGKRMVAFCGQEQCILVILIDAHPLL